MANVFNSVKGLHPRRNAFSAHTYRNDFTGYMGLNIPVYQQHVTAGTRVRLNTFALARLEALLAPIMDNIDLYVHFWKIPYRLLEKDRFTQFISGEIEESEYTGLFGTPHELCHEVCTALNASATSEPRMGTYAAKLAVYNAIFADGGLLDFLGYDASMFATPSQESGNNKITCSGGNNWKTFNYRPVIAYFMLHEHWYMNENVPYYAKFIEHVDALYTAENVAPLATLLTWVTIVFGYSFLPHGWEKDYFTSALPNVQYGDPVTFALGGTAPVGINPQSSYTSIDGNMVLEERTGLKISPHAQAGKVLTGLGASYDGLSYLTHDDDTGSWSATPVTSLQGSDSHINISNLSGEDESGTEIPALVADLQEASSISVNEFRFACALQLFKEREQRFGRRRLEYYKGFFDVTPEDLRIQVPAYLGGGRIPINISDIEQTSATSSGSPLGKLAGKGTAVAGGFAGFSTFCSEESVIIGIAFAMPHITYANSCSRFLFKTNDRFDYFNPSFEHLGEQEIEKLEIYAGDPGPNAQGYGGTFGYTPRFTEYRFHSNEMHGQFKNSLAFWTLGRIFDGSPALNSEFIYMQPKNFNRIFAVDNQPNLKCSMLFKVQMIQPVSKYGTPMLLA